MTKRKRKELEIEREERRRWRQSEKETERETEREHQFLTQTLFEQLNTSGRLEYSERQRTLFELISQV